jgi:hypothetical protein
VERFPQSALAELYRSAIIVFRSSLVNCDSSHRMRISDNPDSLQYWGNGPKNSGNRTVSSQKKAIPRNVRKKCSWNCEDFWFVWDIRFEMESWMIRLFPVHRSSGELHWLGKDKSAYDSLLVNPIKFFRRSEYLFRNTSRYPKLPRDILKWLTCTDTAQLSRISHLFFNMYAFHKQLRHSEITDLFINNWDISKQLTFFERWVDVPKWHVPWNRPTKRAGGGRSR